MLTSVYFIAIIAEAMSGALAAGRRNMDLFGVAVIAFLTALGGGTVRDILLGNFPVIHISRCRPATATRSRRLAQLDNNKGAL